MIRITGGEGESGHTTLLLGQTLSEYSSIDPFQLYFTFLRKNICLWRIPVSAYQLLNFEHLTDRHEI
jgi:hypothetical protein